MFSKNNLIFSIIFFFLFHTYAFAIIEEKSKKDKIDIGGMIMHHILDDYGYEIMEGLVIPLPVILYSNDKGLQFFSSSRLFDKDHSPLPNGYLGYYYDHGHIKSFDSSNQFYDFSITKNVAFLFLNAILLCVVFIIVARSYKSRISPPKGLQSLFEPIILFVRDNIVKPNIGIFLINDSRVNDDI